MHMADALLSPAAGGVMAAASAAAIGYAVKKLGNDALGERHIPLMGVMGAFIFAGQMINFTIPGTGSSGHIGGGILLAALLGPYPALVTLASVLLIQCLFFADGGLLALGCNIFNMGVLTCFFAYPCVYKPFVKNGARPGTIIPASILAVVIGLQAGSFAVVLETLASGVTELPFGAFALLMQPIHLAIGVVEGIVTAAVLCYVHKVQPEILDAVKTEAAGTKVSGKKILAVFAVLALVTGGIFSLFASARPDGLEWSIEGVAGTAELERDSGVHAAAGGIAGKAALMPDYAFSGAPESAAGTSTAGLVGSLITLGLSGGTGLIIYAVRKSRNSKKRAAGAGA